MQIGVELSRAIENKRIFVIDRDEVTRAAIGFMLYDENETHEAASVAEAIFVLPIERISMYFSPKSTAATLQVVSKSVPISSLMTAR